MEGSEPNSAMHLSPEEIAVLAEGKSRELIPPRVLDHLSRCRSCMSAYADVVRYRAGWIAFPELFEGASRDAPARGSSSRTRLRWLAAGAGFALASVIVTGWWGWRLAPRRDADPLKAMLERASSSRLVIPGGEAGAASRHDTYRSGGVTDEEEGQVLERMRAEHERQPRGGQDAQLLAAGLLAAGNTDLAGDYVAEGLARAPSDSRLLTLSAIVAYQSGDLAEAERRLDEALRISPGDLTAKLDLALVLEELGRSDEAKAHFDGVILKAPGSPLAARARAVLARHRRS